MRSIDVCVVARSVQSEVLAINHIDEASSAAAIKIHFHTTPCVYARSSQGTLLRSSRRRHLLASSRPVELLQDLSSQANSQTKPQKPQAIQAIPQKRPRNHEQKGVACELDLLGVRHAPCSFVEPGNTSNLSEQAPRNHKQRQIACVLRGILVVYQGQLGVNSGRLGVKMADCL